MSKEKEFLKSGIWYTIGNVLTKAIAFLALPIFTNLLTTEEYGIFGTFQAYEILLSVFISFGITGTIRAAYNDYKDSFERYVSCLTIPIFIISILLVILDGIYAFVFRDGYISLFILALILNALGNAIREIISSKFVIQNKYAKYLLMSFMMSVLNIVVSYYLCVQAFADHKELGRIWGTVFASLFVALVFLFAQFKKDAKVIWPSAWKYAFVLGIPLILHQLSTSLLGQCDKLMIQHLDGFASAGIYTAMMTIMLIPQVIYGSIDNAWAPWFFNIVAKDRNPAVQREIQTFNGKIVIFFAIIIILFQLAATEIVRLTVSSEYRVGQTLIYVLSVSVFVNFLYIFAVNVEYYYKKTAIISFYTLIAAIFNIVVNIIGILLMGYIGAAFATLISRLLLLCLHSKSARKLSGYSSIQSKTIVCSFMVVAVAAVLTYWIRDFFVVRCFVFAAVLSILLYYTYKNFYRVNINSDVK